MRCVFFTRSEIAVKIKYDRSRNEIDVGCVYAENCFECPFDDCACSINELDLPPDKIIEKRKEVLETARIVKHMYDSGIGWSEIAGQLSWPIRTVKKYLVVAKQEEKKNAKQA